MKNSPRLLRSLLWLWLLLPLLFMALMVALMFAVMAWWKGRYGLWGYGGVWALGLLDLALFARCCFSAGKRFARRAHADGHAPAANFLHRYCGVLIVSGYTALTALAAIFIPTGNEPTWEIFAVVFGWCHPLTSLPIAILHLFGLPPEPWELLAPLAFIYTAFALGMARHFQKNNTPPTQPRGRWIFALALTVSAAVFALRLGAMSARLITGGDPIDDRIYTRQYDPWRAGLPGNKLVIISEPTLTISGDFPCLGGATALYPVYAAAARAIYQTEWSEETELVQTSPAPEEYFVHVSPTPQAYQQLLNGELDVIFALRPSAEQIAEAKERGAEYQITPLGLEAFVFFVNKENPVATLTVSQLRDIYTRRVTDWSQLGGRAGKIMAFQRPKNSGSQTAMEALVMRGEPMAAPLTEEFAQTMGRIVREAAAYRNRHSAIGYSFRFFVETMTGSEQLKLLAVDGVPPSAATIGSGEYPFVSELCAVTVSGKGSELPNVKKLIAWFQSAQGQRLIEEVGYIPLPSPH